jgi:pSer/pThr/pTyr-binding forkhead associated (FHA) protein
MIVGCKENRALHPALREFTRGQRGRLMKLSLEVLTEGKQKGKILPITLSQFLIGRDPQCHLRPASPLISKRHCALLQRDGKVYVRDFDSTNGTFVNEQPVKGEVELKNNDHLKVGPIAFNVVLQTGASVSRPTPPPPTKPVTATQPTKATDETKIPSKEGAPPKNDQAKPAAANKQAAKPAAADGNSDDDVAAILLSLQDDDGGESSGLVPEGSTVFDMATPGAPGSEPPERQLTETEKEREKSKQHQGNTSSAAKSILEKMMRRPRT